MSFKYEVDITKPMQTKFRYEILVEVQLTLQEVEGLQALASQHYDAHCRAVAEVGGFLYGIRNQCEYGGDRKDIHILRFRELDTLCKILEPGFEHPRHGKGFRAGLFERLFPLLKAINEESGRLNG